MNSELKPYVALVDFLADFLGEDTEIVLHDLTDLEHSVVAIRNNHISGRKLGAPVTDLVLQILHDNDYSENNYLCNYKTHGKSGNLLKSGTFFIKNKKNKIIGILCLNMDIQKLYTLRKSLDALLEVTYEENITKQEVHEILGQSVQELTLDKIEEVVRSLSIPPDRMSQEEKVQCIYKLNERGVFLIKGAVSEVAAVLKVSEASIYRYLTKIKRQKDPEMLKVSETGKKPV